MATSNVTRLPSRAQSAPPSEHDFRQRLLDLAIEVYRVQSIVKSVRQILESREDFADADKPGFTSLMHADNVLDVAEKLLGELATDLSEAS